MRPLSASQLLSAWEQGQAQSPTRQALTLLAAVHPDAPADILARLSIGRRDSHLLALRERTFGPQLTSIAPCPRCDERLELTFSVADLLVASPDLNLTGAAQDDSSAEIHTRQIEGYQVRFRLPNSLDLEALAGDHGAADPQQLLLQRCLLAVGRDGQAQAIDQLPADLIEAIVAQMAEADPQADVQLALACPACGRQWQAIFDIVSFFWSELNTWAYRTLREVHTLASAYGWREADILAMSPWRRQRYLDMVRE